MKAIILAAGQGMRLNDVIRFPKCLINIGDKTILEHQIKALKECDICEIFLVIGTKGYVWSQESYESIKEICKKERIEIVFNFDNDKTQNTYSLFLAMKEIEKTSFLSIDGDVFCNRDVISFACENLYDAALICKRTDDISKHGTHVIVDKNNKIIDIGKEKDVVPSTPFWYMHHGITKISASYFDQFKEIIAKEEYRPFDLSRPYKEFSEKYELYVLEKNQEWVNVNTPEDLKEAEHLWKELK